MQYFEDLTAGDTDEFGTWTFSRDEIIEFAREYDPLHFHLDEEAPYESVFEGLVASGLQTMAVSHRLTVDNFLRDVAVMGGPGIEEAYMQTPVRPGDTLRVRIEVEETDDMDGDPDRGFLRIRETAFNQHDEQVMSMVILTFVKRRPEP
jgi:acyl dehydratase